MRRALLSVALLVCGSSCVASQWDRYDASQYVLAMTPTEEAVDGHIEFLESWAKQSDLPPGLWAELGYYLALAGRAEEASAAFEREVARAPESAKFVQALRTLALAQPAETVDEAVDETVEPDAPDPVPGAGSEPSATGEGEEQ